MQAQEYIDHIKKLVTQEPGKYSDTDLIKEIRDYGNKQDSFDPGFVFARETIGQMIKDNTLEMKAQKKEKILQMSPSQKAFIGNLNQNETNNN